MVKINQSVHEQFVVLIKCCYSYIFIFTFLTPIQIKRESTLTKNSHSNKALQMDVCLQLATNMNHQHLTTPYLKCIKDTLCYSLHIIPKQLPKRLLTEHYISSSALLCFPPNFDHLTSTSESSVNFKNAKHTLKQHKCTGFGWDRVKVLHSSLYGDTLHISNLFTWRAP